MLFKELINDYKFINHILIIKDIKFYTAMTFPCDFGHFKRFLLLRKY